MFAPFKLMVYADLFRLILIRYCGTVVCQVPCCKMHVKNYIVSKLVVGIGHGSLRNNRHNANGVLPSPQGDALIATTDTAGENMSSVECTHRVSCIVTEKQR